MSLELGNILLGLFFGIVGISAWRYGKQNTSARHMLLGVVLIAYPYFIPNFWIALALGLVLSVFLFWP
jgi:hypothetical protein